MKKSAGTRRPSSKTLSTRHKKKLPKTTIEVDYDEGDEEMKEEEEDDEEVAVDDEEEEEGTGDVETAAEAAKMPKLGIEPRRRKHTIAREGDDQQ